MVEVLNNRYKLLQKCGSGGTGEVYEAEDVRLKRRVAVKLVRAVDRGSRDLMARLKVEAEHLAMVNHPAVVTLYDILESPNRISVVMEIVDGVHYRDLIRRKGMTETEFFAYFGQLLSALEAVHKVGLVHRDVNPRNILVTADNRMKLLDFGLSTMQKDENPRAGGTLGYMAPESLRTGARLDYGVDIYAAGMVAYQSFLGMPGFRRLYHTSEPREWVRWILSKERFKTLKTLEVPVSDDLSRVIARMIEKDPKSRYQRISDIFRALRSMARRARKEREAASEAENRDKSREPPATAEGAAAAVEDEEA